MNNNNSALDKTGSWTTNDLRNAATNWNLTGDKALLGLLQNMHENLHNRTEDVINHLDNLNTDLGNTSLCLKNVNNRFIGLNNTQFVECAVQDDDVEIIKKKTDSHNTKQTTDTYKNAMKEEHVEEILKKEKILESVCKSLKHLEGLCERLDISPDTESDSDSQTEDIILSRTVLKPTDPYLDNPLPHIIGSREWKKKWHVGLHECSSESESDNEEYKDSLRKKKNASYSSCDDFYDENVTRNSLTERKSQMTLPIHKTSSNQPTRTSGISTPTNYSTDTEDSEVANINANIKSVNQSNAKEKDENEQEKQIYKPKVNSSDFAAELAKKLGGVNFAPNADSSKSVANKNVAEKSNASTKKKDSKKAFKDPGVARNIFLDEPPPLDNESEQEDKDDLFGSNDDNDSISDGLFSGKPSKSSSVNQGLFGNAPSSKYGGLFSDVPDDEDDEEEIVKPVKKKPIKKPTPKKSIFDDDSDEELFTGKLAQKETGNANKNVEIKNSQKPNAVKTNKSGGLFDDDLDSNEDTQVKNKPIKDVVKNVERPPSKGLFDDSDEESNLFGGNLSFVKKSEPVKSSQVVANTEASRDTPKKKISLFDDDSDDGDLFSSLKSTAKQIQTPPTPQDKKIPKNPVDDIKKTEPAMKSEEKVTEEDLFSTLRMPEKKSTNPTNVPSDLKSTEDTQQKVNEEKPETTKKPAGAVSMFGDNLNILKGPNSLAASIMARKRKESSSEESANDDSKIVKEEVTKIKSSQIKTETEKDMISEQTSAKDESVGKRDVKTGISDYGKKPVEKIDAPENKPTLDKSSNEINFVPKLKPDPIVPKEIEKKIDKDLFGDSGDDLFIKNDRVKGIFEDTEPLELPPPLETSTQVIKEPRNANSLFDDEDDDLFASLKGNKGFKSNASNLFDDVPNEEDFRNDVNLFSDEPPDFDYNPIHKDVMSESTGSKESDVPIVKDDFVKTNDDNIENQSTLLPPTFKRDDVKNQPTKLPADDRSLDKKNISLFGDSDDHEDIKNQSINHPALSKNNTSLFGDPNERDDPKNQSTILPPNNKIPNKKNTSLFGDSSDEDDLFSSLLKKKSETEKTVKDTKIDSNIVTESTGIQSKPKISTKPETEPTQIHKMLSTGNNDDEKTGLLKDAKDNPKIPESNKPVIAQAKPKMVSKPEKEDKTLNDQTDKISNESTKADTDNVNENLNIETTKPIVDNKPIIEKEESVEKDQIKQTDDTKPIETKVTAVKKLSDKFIADSAKEETDGGTLSSISKSEKDVTKSPESPARKINKLKSNLNINVKALMPGSAPVMRKKLDIEPQTASTQLSPEESVGFESQANSLDSVLANNWSRDKIKVQVKRRPQSRRARQEAARKSAADILFSFDSTDSSSYINSLPNSPTDDVSNSFSSLNSEVNDSLDNSTLEQQGSSILTIGKLYKNDEKQQSEINVSNTASKITVESEVDVVNLVPEKLNKETVKEVIKSSESAKQETIVSNNEKHKSLFDNLDNNIFSTTKQTTPKSLFGDEDDNDDLFGEFKNKVKPIVKNPSEDAKTSHQGAIKKAVVKKIKTKNVFNDSDSDSELFSSKPKAKGGKGKAVDKKASLFGESDTEDDLFTTVPKRSINVTKQSNQKSLFGDDEDEDDMDIFKVTNKSTQAKTSDNKNVVETKQSTNAKQKTTTAQVTTFDPLSSFLNDT